MSSRDARARPDGMTEPGDAEVREALGTVRQHLDKLAAGVARLLPAEPPPAGELLDEPARAALAAVQSLLAVTPGLGREAALLLAVDRAVHRAGADCAAVFVPTSTGELEALAQRGFPPGPLRVPAGAGIAGRAFREGESIRGGPAHRRADPLLGGHGLGSAVALAIQAAGSPVRGVLFAGRRRPVPFAGEALEALVLIADRVAAVLAAPPAGGEPAAGLPDQDLDLARAAGRITREAAGRLGATRMALLLVDPDRLRPAALVGVATDAVAPAPAVEPLAAVLATGRAWVAPPSPAPAPGSPVPSPWAAAGPLERFLGAVPRLVVPLVVGGRAIAVLVAGGPATLDPAALTDLLAPAARAIANARLYAETVAALAEREAREHRPRPAAPAGPARDLVGLLAVLLARIGLVRERVHDATLAADLAVAEEAAWRAAEVVRGALGFVPGARSDELVPVELGGLIRAAAEEAERRWRARGGPVPALALDVEPLPPVRGCGAELAEALAHLLDNAAEASPGGEAVTVRARWDGGGRVEVIVEDQGSGMDETVRSRALEPFFSTRGAGRLGLGLPVVQAIVERHRGALELRGAPGAGTTVRLTLPTAASVPAGVRARRVLVVEDDAAIREAIVETLGRRGHVALEAADGEAALSVVQREPVDAVVTDLALPGIAGVELAQAVKRLRPGTPVLLLTAWPGQLDPAALAGAVDRVVEKPAGVEEVLEALESLLGARGERRG